MSKAYALQNVSFNDETRTDDYLLKDPSEEKEFFIPKDMKECEFLIPSELINSTCTNTLKELVTIDFSSVVNSTNKK